MVKILILIKTIRIKQAIINISYKIIIDFEKNERKMEEKENAQTQEKEKKDEKEREVIN